MRTAHSTRNTQLARAHQARSDAVTLVCFARDFDDSDRYEEHYRSPELIVA